MQKYKLFYSYPNLFELFFQLFQYKYNNMLITRLLSNNQQPMLKIYLSRLNLIRNLASKKSLLTILNLPISEVLFT